MKTAGFVTVVMVLAAGCASKPAGEQPAKQTVSAGEFGSPACFLQRTVQDFQVLDDRNLIVFSSGESDAYHVQISPPDSGLRFATALGFESRSSQICGYAGDSLLIGQDTRRLFVTGVYRLDGVALGSLRARFGKGPATEKAKPQPGEGATIEHDIGSQEKP